MRSGSSTAGFAVVVGCIIGYVLSIVELSLITEYPIKGDGDAGSRKKSDRVEGHQLETNVPYWCPHSELHSLDRLR